MQHLAASPETETQSLVLGPAGDSEDEFSGCRFWDREEKFQYLAARSAELARMAVEDRGRCLAAGLLWAWEEGAERVLLVGPQCFPSDADFLSGHAVAGQVAELTAWEADRGWYNTAQWWQSVEGQGFYPRGYPLEERGRGQARSRMTRLRAFANVGCCLGEGDVDAITSLERRVTVSGISGPSLALSPGTWSSFSSDNLALSWEAVPAYFVCPNLGHYGAIWGSFLLQRVAGHLGRGIRFGGPTVHRSASANPWQELDTERPGLRRSGELARALRAIPLQGANALQCIGEIAQELPKAWPAGSLRGPNAWSGYEIEWRRRFLEGLQAWVGALETVRHQARTGKTFAEREAEVAAARQLRQHA